MVPCEWKFADSHFLVLRRIKVQSRTQYLMRLMRWCWCFRYTAIKSVQPEKLLQITKWLTNSIIHQQFSLTGGFDAWTAACCHRRGINPWCSVYISPHLLFTATLMYCFVYILVPTSTLIHCVSPPLIHHTLLCDGRWHILVACHLSKAPRWDNYLSTTCPLLVTTIQIHL